MKTNLFLKPFILLAVIGLALAACGGEEATPLPTEAPTPTLQATAIPDAAATTAVEPTSEPTTGSRAGESSFMGVSFTAEPTFFGGLQSFEIMAAQPWSPGAGPGGGNPETIRFLFSQVDEAFISPYTPQILIYPVADFEDLYPFPDVAERVTALRTLLTNRPPTVEESLPLLPVFNAAETFHSQLAYLDFQNGSGIRFIAQYDQGVNPITNQSIFYTFQGLTNDGQFYVAAFFPVAASVLPADSSDFDNTVLETAESYLAYKTETVASLEALTTADFTPDLAEIDAVMEFLNVAPQNFPSPVQTKGFIYENSYMVYNVALADDVTVEKIPAQFVGVDGSPVLLEGVPDSTRFTFARPETSPIPATLLLRPIKDENDQYYAALPEEEVARFETLSALLVEQPPAGSLDGYYQSQLAYLDFGNGSGIRSVTYVPGVEGPEEITNENVYYVFEGLTDDGRYYLQMTFPVSSDLLLLEATLTPEEVAALEADFNSYVAEQLQPLDEIRPADFTPDLALLDELIASLFVDTFSGTFDSPGTETLPEDPLDCVNNSDYVADVTIPDGTEIAPGETFTKTWRIANNGTCTWRTDYRWAFLSGETFGWVGPVNFPANVPPGEEFEVSLILTAPETSGNYVGYWQLQTADGTAFGIQVYVDIIVP